MADVPLSVIDVQQTIDAGETDRARIGRELAGLVQGEVRFGRHDRMLYSTDASIYQVEPIGVVIPRSIAEAEAVVNYCVQRRLPILARGGGTALAGQTVNTAIVIDFSRDCNRIIELDPQRRMARVEPGVVLDRLNEAAGKHGLRFGPDVASSAQATLGGMIANNSAGAHSILYGRTVEHLRSVDVLLADGSKLRLERGAARRDPRAADLTKRIAAVVRPISGLIRQRYPKTRRHVDGYNLDLLLNEIEASTPSTFEQVNLAHLICGSEGTLGVVVEVELDLVAAPKRRALTILAFGSVDEALEALGPILATKPAAVELLDETVITLARQNIEYSRYVDLLPGADRGVEGAVLYVEHFSDGPEALEASFKSLQAAVPAAPSRRFTDPAAMAQAWKLRKAGEPLLHTIPGLRKPVTFIEDTAVDPARLPEFVREFRKIVAAHGTTAAYYAHASVGCLHIRPVICLRDQADVTMMQAIASEVTDLVVQYGGALSGEHGDGRVRSHLLEKYFGPGICEAFRAIKAIFDPRNLLNPGIITNPPAMTEHLRVRPEERIVEVPPVRTFFRYEREHGFDEAVEMCNGAGVCRKTSGGTMCPSYRATLDERHATRGRGNALRLAITGQFSADGRSPRWDDDETIRTLDLCLSCKACKSECPSNVDIAKLKAEYHAQQFAQTGRIPRAVRFFGRVRRINRLGSAMHWIANAIGGLGLTRQMMEWALDIDRRRSLPRFERSLYRWFSSRKAASAPMIRKSAPTVVLLPDCFCVYNEPHVGHAAVRVLEAFGYRVVLPKLGCCGRSLISVGMLAEAARVCRQTASDLIKCLEDCSAVAVVGLEPSCVSAIKDDWVDLEMNFDPARIRALADMTLSIEDFLERHWQQHPAQPRFRAPGGAERILLHGHCHQKALWGMDGAAGLLRRFAGERLQVIDSGCCGMAGGFGFTRGHFDLSMRIGELSLLPAVRAEPQATILAAGTSCRHQIHDGAGRRALHPIELIADLLEVADPPARGG